LERRFEEFGVIMNCPAKYTKAAGILLDYCAQSLTPVQMAEFEAHLGQCPDCARIVAAQKEVWGALDTWTPVPVSSNFDARLYARIAEEETVPAWRSWLSRIFQPPVPYSLWKAAVPVAACAALAVGLFIRMPEASQHNVQPQLRAEKVDIEQVEQALQDIDILTPAAQAPVGSM
jgi:anti-sigma factor RsiW